MLSIASLFVAVMFLTPPAPYEPITENAVLEAPTRHIRTSDASIRRLLQRGYRQSRTFADLMARLQRSDVIVYIEDVPRLDGGLEGRMMMLPRAHGFRYVRIQIAKRGSPEDAVAVLAHELQHAVEIAAATDVSDSKGLTRLYKRIGVRSGEHVYDTVAAQETGRLVRRELSIA